MATSGRVTRDKEADRCATSTDSPQPAAAAEHAGAEHAGAEHAGAEQTWLPPLAGIAVGTSAVRRSAHPHDELGGTAIPETTLGALRRAAGSGARLPDQVERDMGSAFGHDLSVLRVHDDAQSHQLAESMQARAFTYGQDIYFARGQYAPHSPSGQHLLAHELSHAVAPVASYGSGPVIGRADDPAERQADAHADRVVGALRRSAALHDRGSGGCDERRAEAADGGVVGALRRQAAIRGDEVIRRAVGFEFQCRNWDVKDTAGEIVKSDKGKEKRLYPQAEPNGWYLMSDGGDPEFVIEHSDDERELLTRLGRAVTFATGMAADRRDKQRIMTKSKHNKVNMVDLVAGDRPVTADPQVTAGIAMARIGELFSQLGQRKVKSTDEASSEANKQLMTNKQVKHYTGDDLLLAKARTAVYDELKKAFVNNLLVSEGIPAMSTARDEVIGVLSLLVSYLMKAKELGHAYIKDFPVLGKTDLGTMVQHSPLARGSKPPVQQADVEPAPREWSPEALEQIVKAVMRAGGRANGAELVYAGGAPTGDPDEDGPTVRQWLDGVIKAHHDLLSYRKNRKFADDSMGNLGKLDTVGTGSKTAAPVLELRRVKESLPADEWLDFGTRIWHWLEQLNDLDQYPGDLKG